MFMPGIIKESPRGAPSANLNSVDHLMKRSSLF